jgi:hypothetical protein
MVKNEHQLKLTVSIHQFVHELRREMDRAQTDTNGSGISSGINSGIGRAALIRCIELDIAPSTKHIGTSTVRLCFCLPEWTVREGPSGHSRSWALDVPLPCAVDPSGTKAKLSKDGGALVVKMTEQLCQ